MNYKPATQDRTAVNHLLRYLPEIQMPNGNSAPTELPALCVLRLTEIAHILSMFFVLWRNPETDQMYCGDYCWGMACAIQRYRVW